MKKNIFLTGLPGCGKTTAIRKIVATSGVRARGFYTEETRKNGVRTGFMIRTLDGKEGYLAHVDIDSRYKVSKYGVDIANIDSIAVSSVQSPEAGEVLVIDEIGKMECFSKKFCDAVKIALDSPAMVLGTIALKGGGFIAEVKKRPDVEIIEITRANRDEIVNEIVRRQYPNSKHPNSKQPPNSKSQCAK